MALTHQQYWHVIAGANEIIRMALGEWPVVCLGALRIACHADGHRVIPGWRSVVSEASLAFPAVSSQPHAACPAAASFIAPTVASPHRRLLVHRPHRHRCPTA
jgi:hypothetical protein